MVFIFVASIAQAQEEAVLTEVLLGQPGELKLVHISPSPFFPREGLLKFSTQSDRLNAQLHPGRYFYRYRSNSNINRAISKSGRLYVDAPNGTDTPRTDFTIAWTPPMDPKTQNKIPFFWSVTDAKGNFVIRDQVITEENPTVQLLMPGTYFWTMTDEIGASWTVPKQIIVNPFPPSQITATVNKDRSVDLAWRAPKNVDAFLLKLTDADGFEIFSTKTPDRFYSFTEMPIGTYHATVQTLMTVLPNKRADEKNAEEEFEKITAMSLMSKPVSTTFEMPGSMGGEKPSSLVILSPMDRINFEGQKYIFSWHVKSANPPKRYHLQVKSLNPGDVWEDIKQIDVTGRYDESTFQNLPLGRYKFRVAGLNEKDEQIPSMSDKGEFTIESRVAEARLGRVALNTLMFGPEMSLMAYRSISNSLTTEFSSQITGVFVRSESTGRGSNPDEGSFPYNFMQLRSQFMSQQAQTLTYSELSFGSGRISTPSNSGWITKYGIGGALMRLPDLVDVPVQTGHINMINLLPHLEFGKTSKHYSYQLGIDLSIPLLEITDTMTASQDPFSRMAFGYRITGDIQFPFFWPWSVGAQIGYERNDFHYRSPLNATMTDSTFTGINSKLYLSYPY